MGKAKKERKTAFGQAVIRSLTEFLGTVERGEQITARNVKLNLEPRPYGKREVERTRERLGVSQAVFAQLLAVSLKLVQSWEQGIRKPSKLACRLLDDINRDPQRWLKHQLQERTTTNAAKGARQAHFV